MPALAVTIRLSAAAGQRLRQRASAQGKSLETYLQDLAEADGLGPGGPALAEAPALSLEEFDRAVDELSEGLPPLPALPADFSRRDLYADHD